MPGPDRRVFLEQSPRTWIQWTPELIRSAFLMAEGGSLRLAADLCEQIRGDDRARAVLDTLVLGVLGLPFEVLPAADEDAPIAARKPDAWAAAIAAAYARDFPRIAPLSDLAELVKWGLLQGVGIAEHVWELSDRTHRLIPRLKTWHPRWLRWDWQQRCWILTIDKDADLRITPGDGKWVVFTPFGQNRPWACGLWRSFANPWLSKAYANRDWNGYSEVHGQPIRVVETPQGADIATRKQALADVASMGARGVTALPEGYTLKLAEATARTWETFPGLIENANTAMAVCALGQNLTTEASSGTYGLGAVHQLVQQDRIEFVALAVQECLAEQSVPWWTEYNFGDRSLTPLPHWDVVPPADAQTKGQVRASTAGALAALGQAAQQLEKVGVKLDCPEICSDWGVPVEVAPGCGASADPSPTSPPHCAKR